ncbi:MAG: response regulator transcription factor [Pseudoclavibacter sp.]
MTGSHAPGTFPAPHPAASEVRVLVVDDHPIVRAGIVAALSGEPGFQIVGEAGDGADALVQADAVAPSLVLMDLRMPGMGGVEATRRLLVAHPGLLVVVLTTYETDEEILSAIEAGASGYLLKAAPRAELIAGIRAVADGQVALAPSVARTLAARPRAAPGPLSRREIDVLRLVAAGRGNAQIATDLFISEATVKTHLQRIFAKLDAGNRAQAVTLAIQRGLLRPGTQD